MTPLRAFKEEGDIFWSRLYNKETESEKVPMLTIVKKPMQGEAVENPNYNYRNVKQFPEN
jgi:hypothetical protein